MVEKANEFKKGSITEQDTATLLQRYPATTVLALLQEVANSPEVKIDWNRLVAKTSTGISNAREYQMIWRHLAYGDALLDKIDDGAQPLDDDSDIEYELEAFPADSEVATEAAACAKVLIASGQSSITHENSQQTSSVLRKNIRVPVSVREQPLSAATASAVDTAEEDDGSAHRKKRKNWSMAEDLELIAAVEKCGEGNWVNISGGGSFKGNRRAAQLRQRWSVLRRQRGKKDSSGKLLEPHLAAHQGNSSGKLSEAQLAARHSLSLALNMPNLTANTIGTGGTKVNCKFARTNATSNPVPRTATKAEPESQQGLNPIKPYQMGLSSSTTKSQVTSSSTLAKPNSSNDDMVRATAIAAGARIVSPSDSASLLKAAQAKNYVRITPTGGSSARSEPQPNLHNLRTFLATTPRSTPLPTAVTPSATHPASLKALPQMCLHSLTNGTLVSKQIEGVCCPDAQLPSKQVVSTAEGSIIAELVCEQPQDAVVLSTDAQDEKVQVDKVESPEQKAELKNLSTTTEKPVDSLNIARDETDNKAFKSVQTEQKQCAKDNESLCSLVNAGGSDSSAVGSYENQSTSEKQTDLMSIVTDGCNGKQVSKEEAAI